MHSEGWNSIPRGFGASFDVPGAPWWLRVLFHSPFVDRFAYPVLVSRGLGWLTENPGAHVDEGDQAAAVARGWRIESDSTVPGGAGAGLSGTALVETSRSALRWRRRRYAIAAQRRRLLRRVLPHEVMVPGGVRLERRSSVAWRVRGPLLVLAAVAGRRLPNRAGWLLGVACAVAAEILFSYRRPDGPGDAGSGGMGPDGGDDGSAGVREPRRPLPVLGAASAQIPGASPAN